MSRVFHHASSSLDQMILKYKTSLVVRSLSGMKVLEIISRFLSASFGLFFSLLIHGGALVLFLRDPSLMPAAPEPSLIAVSFVRSPIQAKEIFIKHSEKNYTILKAEKNREKGVPLTSDRSGSQKKLSKQSQKDNAVKAISNNSHPETFPGLVREYSEPQKKNLQPAQHGGELNISSPRYHAGSRENPLPDYPYVSRRRGEEGKVTCSVKVSPEGLPEQVEIRESSGHERLDQAAQNVLSSWVFEPAQKDFEKIYGFLEISITFRLTEGVKI